MTRALSGHPQDMAMPPPPAVPEPWLMVGAVTNTAYAGPWGISFTANLTPDPETGLGKWSLRNFVDTIRSGRHLGRGREVLPPMPMQVYRNWTDADFEAVYSYLRTVPPIKNAVPEPVAPGASRRRQVGSATLGPLRAGPCRPHSDALLRRNFLYLAGSPRLAFFTSAHRR